MFPQIAIFGATEDPHVRAVASHIQSRGKGCTLIEPDGRRCCFCVEPATNDQVYSHLNTNRSLDKIRSAWWRIKPPFQIMADSVESYYEQRFASLEWNVTLDALASQFTEAKWVNDRAAERAASNKVYQLSAASRLGLRTPRTIISNDVALIKEFIGGLSSKRCIHKTMTPFMSPSGMVKYSTVIERHHLEKHQNNFEACPSIFQEYILSSCEYRVTIIGHQIFPVRIDRVSSSPDWRRTSFDNHYEAVSLPPRIADQLLSLQSQLDLRFGAYDLIQDERGEILFLEVNPAGQWFWIEELLGLPLSAAMADLLIELASIEHG